MSGRALIFGVIAVVWGLGRRLQAVTALHANQPYVFATWDGGIFRVGKHLSPVAHRSRSAWA